MKAKIKLALLSLAILSLNSCENSDIDSSYVLQTNENIKNNEDLQIVKETFNYLKSNSSEEIKANFVDENAKEVSLKEEIAKLFDPANHPCSLPNRIASKLKRAKEEGKPWAPKIVRDQILELPETVLYIPRNSITSILHLVTIKKQDNSSFKWPVKAPSYDELNIDDFVLTGDYNSFFYSLDCSGYVNAAIEASASVPGADIKTVAKTSLTTQNSMFVAGGVIVSPLSAAYYGNLVEMDTISRIKILEAILLVPNTSDNDIIEMPISFEAVWASKTGSSSFNGSGDITAKGAGGFATAQVSANASAGGSISRKSKFSAFNTYVSKTHPIEHPTVITISNVKAILRNLKNAH